MMWPALYAATLLALYPSSVLGQFLLGVGIGDVTGPVTETNMMGYAALGQTDTGLHMRQRSRAYIVAEATNKTNRFLLINSDIAMGDSGVRRAIVAKLTALYPGVYNENNIGLVGTHQHAGVGGFLENLLPQLTSLGFVRETFNAIVDGSVKAAVDAHNSLAAGSLSFGTTDILQGNINRSPSAYLANPAEERARYAYDQDKTMTLIKFKGSSGGDRGFLSFFPVHGTSLYENNTLVSADNKGMAAYLYENSVEPNTAPGKTTFVAGFVQSNVGDTSPNTLGAFCESPGKPWHGQPCEFYHSTCGNNTQECHGRGPGFHVSDFESNYLIGSYQFQGAKTIMDSNALKSLNGSVRAAHIYVDMSTYTFTGADGQSKRTCKPAMGYAFAGGTTDGPGAFDFKQGTTTGNPFWEIVKGFVTPTPSADQAACHAPKPILLNTGEATQPYDWQPKIVNVQLFRVGQMVILLVPGEFTTMAGRRLREAIKAKLVANPSIMGTDVTVVIAGPSNTYGHYVTTQEEYGVQRYEGGSTIYGPHTLEAYINIYGDMLGFIGDAPSGTPSQAGAPLDLTQNPLSLRTGVVLDNVPIGSSFGKVLTAPSGSYSKGSTMSVKFQGATPRNNLRLEGTFLTIDRQVDGQWQTYRTDSHPSTKYNWKRTNGALGYSEVTITWDIERDAPSGTYRVTYFGDYKNGWTGKISAFTGQTGSFTVA